MRSLHFIGITGGILFVLAGNAWGASKCGVGGCGAQSRMCMETGLLERLVCVGECYVNNAQLSDRIACDHGCAQDFLWGTKPACKGDRASCVANCVPAPDIDMTCVQDCGVQLQGCVGPARFAAFTCAKGCKGASDKLGCFQACLTSAQTDGAACGDAFSTCLAACGPSAP
jgi:hypothetical protein